MNLKWNQRGCDSLGQIAVKKALKVCWTKIRRDQTGFKFFIDVCEDILYPS